MYQDYLPAGYKLEVTRLSPTGKTYLVAYSRIESHRVLFLVDEKNKTLKKVATADSPLDLYPKAT